MQNWSPFLKKNILWFDTETDVIAKNWDVAFENCKRTVYLQQGTRSTHIIMHSAPPPRLKNVSFNQVDLPSVYIWPAI